MKVNPLLERMLNARAAGLSVIPINWRNKLPATNLLPIKTDDNGDPILDPETGKPERTWEPYQRRLATEDEIREWCRRGIQAYAIVCGMASGGLHVEDGDDMRLYDQWRASADDLLAGLPVGRTGSDKRHTFWRTPEPGRNDKHAWVPDESESDGRRIGLESRAEGGYVLGPGSRHPSGDYYEVLEGDIFKIPTISPARHKALVAAAREQCEAPKGRRQLERERKQAERAAMTTTTRATSTVSTGESVIDIFNERYSVEEMLERNGYTPRGDRYSRPGGTNPSVAIKDGKSFHHNTNDPLSDGHWHDAFDLYCYHAHSDDYTAAVREAARELGLPPLQRQAEEQPPSSPLADRFKAEATTQSEQVVLSRARAIDAASAILEESVELAKYRKFVKEVRRIVAAPSEDGWDPATKITLLYTQLELFDRGERAVIDPGAKAVAAAVGLSEATASAKLKKLDGAKLVHWEQERSQYDRDGRKVSPQEAATREDALYWRNGSTVTPAPLPLRLPALTDTVYDEKQRDKARANLARIKQAAAIIKNATCPSCHNEEAERKGLAVMCRDCGEVFDSEHPDIRGVPDVMQEEPGFEIQIEVAESQFEIQIDPATPGFEIQTALPDLNNIAPSVRTPNIEAVPTNGRASLPAGDSIRYGGHLDGLPMARDLVGPPPLEPVPPDDYQLDMMRVSR